MPTLQSRLRGLLGGGLLTLTLLQSAIGPPGALTVTPAHASTVTGTPVTISGLDNLSATVDDQAKKGVGKALGIVIALAGLAGVVTGHLGVGAVGLGSGVAMAFVPNIIGSAFDATQGVPLMAPPLLPPADAWWTPALALLYPSLLALRILQDPVFLGTLIVFVLLHVLPPAAGARGVTPLASGRGPVVDRRPIGGR